MRKAWSARLIDYLTARGASLKDDAEVYAYGLQVGVDMLLNAVSTLLIGFCFRMPLEAVAFLAGYMVLRSYTGGYHAESALVCYLQSCALVVGVLLLSSHVPADVSPILSLAFLVTACAVIFPLTPVPATHKPLDKTEIIYYRKQSRRRLLVEIIVIVLLGIFQLYRFALILSMGLFFIACLMLLGLVKNKYALRNGE